MPAKALILIWVFLSLSIINTNHVSASEPIQGSSQYTTPSGIAPADGTSTETVSVQLRDINQNPVVGDMITLSSSNDTTAIFPKNNQTTDSNGNASFTIATTTPGTLKISLYDATQNITFTDWFSVTFYDPDLGCSNVPPAPNLISAVSPSSGKVTLTWTLLSDPVSNYLVSFGLESKKYIYGNSNVGKEGTKSTTIAALSGGKTYYFAVAANNNCGTGGYSNEIAVRVNPVPSVSILPPGTSSPNPILNMFTPIPSSTPTATIQSSVLQTPQVLRGSNQKLELDNKFINLKKLAIGLIGTGSLMIIYPFISFFINKNRSGKY